MDSHCKNVFLENGWQWKYFCNLLAWIKWKGVLGTIHCMSVWKAIGHVFFRWKDYPTENEMGLHNHRHIFGVKVAYGVSVSWERSQWTAILESTVKSGDIRVEHTLFCIGCTQLERYARMLPSEWKVSRLSKRKSSHKNR